MRKLIYLFFVFFLLFSCKKEEVSNLPFQVNHNISCYDLYKNGYKRTFGVDVILIGKIMNDTTIHYQIDMPIRTEKINYDDFEETTIHDSISKEENEFEKYIKQDALTLNDSIYELVWGNIQKQKRDICSDGQVSWRNFMLELQKNETKNYRNTIDKTKFKILDVDRLSDYYIDQFKVVNLISKDTFNCSVYEHNKKYFFSSTFILINYE